MFSSDQIDQFGYGDRQKCFSDGALECNVLDNSGGSHYYLNPLLAVWILVHFDKIV